MKATMVNVSIVPGPSSMGFYYYCVCVHACASYFVRVIWRSWSSTICYPVQQVCQNTWLASLIKHFTSPPIGDLVPPPGGHPRYCYAWSAWHVVKGSLWFLWLQHWHDVPDYVRSEPLKDFHFDSETIEREVVGICVYNTAVNMLPFACRLLLPTNWMVHSSSWWWKVFMYVM